LVVTNLGRTACPVLRYRTGDIVVRSQGTCRCGRSWARLEGGILARADDMISIRGVNVYPAAIEAVVRAYPEVAEFRSTASRRGAMSSLKVEIEAVPGSADPEKLIDEIGRKLREALGLTIPVSRLDADSLPRFEMKARRFVIEEEQEGEGR
jgi:phenylacetate-CoA ligase